MVWIGTVGVVAAVVGLSADWSARGLFDRAYAASNVGEHQVLHEVDMQVYAAAPGFYDRVEGWLLPADGRARVVDIHGNKRSPYVTISEWIITATGRGFGRGCLSGCRARNVSSFINGHSRWESEGRMTVGFGGPPWLPGTFAQRLRAASRAHALVSDGTTTFAGKAVKRFTSMGTGGGERWISWRPGTRPPISARNPDYIHIYALIDWYLDPATARLVGFRAWGCGGPDHIRSCERREAPPSFTRIVTFQRLDPTPQNLAELTGRNAPRGAR